MASPNVKRKILTLSEKMKVIDLDKTGLSSRKIADQLNVGRTQIQNILKRKCEYLEDFENNVNPDRKRRRHITGNEEINDLCWEWFKDATSRRINVTGPLLQEKALKFAADLNNESFKASNGWLESFRRRHNITFSTMSGERGDVNDQTVDDWKSKLPDLCKNYEPKNIFNMDESGLFYRDTSKKTLFIKGEDCAGGKRSKERLTLALCSSMTGEKLKPLIIGKSGKPRCFAKIKPEKLPVTYKFNQKAWMNSTIMEEWLKNLDRQMYRQKRKILLFLDNAPSHPDIPLQNVELKFLPPNTTSKTQPMDMGIIQTTKLKFRKKQMQYMINQMDRQPGASGSDLLRQISILDAIYWVSRAWQDVHTSTIEKCFSMAGFIFVKDTVCETSDDDDDDDDDVPLAVIKMAKEVYGCDLKQLSEIDNSLKTCDENSRDWSLPATELLEQIDNTDMDSDSESEAENVDGIGTGSEVQVCSVSDAHVYIMKLRRFAEMNGNSELLDSIMSASDILSEMSLGCTKQKSIKDFFLS